VLHRAVTLAQLHSGQWGTRSHRPGGGGETIGGQCRRKDVRTRDDILPRGGESGGIPLLELGDALAGELADSLPACVRREEPQRRGGDVVVVTVHADVTGLRQDVGTSWATPASTGSAGGFVLHDRARLDQQVKVAANRGGRQPEAVRKGGRGERAVLGDRPPDPVPGARLKHVRRGAGPLRTVGNGVVGDKHKNSVT